MDFGFRSTSADRVMESSANLATNSASVSQALLALDVAIVGEMEPQGLEHIVPPQRTDDGELSFSLGYSG